MLLTPTFRVTRLSNSRQLLLTSMSALCFQNNMTPQLMPTPLNSMSALRFQNNTTPQLMPTPLNSMSALRFQNNTLRFAYKESTNSHSSFFFSQRSHTDSMWVIYSITFYTIGTKLLLILTYLVWIPGKYYIMPGTIHKF